MSISSAAAAAPASSDSARPPGSPARVKTLRPWSESVWKSRTRAARPNASVSRPTTSSSPAVETLGTASRSGISRSDQQLAAAEDRLAVDFDGRFLDHDVEVDGHLDRAADAGRGAEGDVGGAEDLLVLEDVSGQDRLLVGADPELGDVGAVGAVRGQQFHQPGALVAGRADEVAALDGQVDGRLDQADRGDRSVDHQRALGGPFDRRDEALAAGQVPEGALGGEFAGVDDPLAALEREAQVGAVAIGDV